MKKGLLLLLSLSLLFLSGCSRAPQIDDIRDRVIELIEASVEINEVFLGAGLPVYDRNDEKYADLYSFYASASYANDYDIVRPEARFTSIREIKDAAALVYSADLLESNLFVNAFVGYAISGIGSETVTSSALYVEDGTYLYQSVEHRNYLTNGIKQFDYSSMQISRPSSASAVYVTINSFYPSNPSDVSSTRLRLILSESGSWLLDSLTV